MNNYNWIDEEYIPSLVDACLVEIKDYIENNGKQRYGSIERMFRIKKFDVATSAVALSSAFELGLLDKEEYMYEVIKTKWIEKN